MCVNAEAREFGRLGVWDRTALTLGQPFCSSYIHDRVVNTMVD